MIDKLIPDFLAAFQPLMACMKNKWSGNWYSQLDFNCWGELMVIYHENRLLWLLLNLSTMDHYKWLQWFPNYVKLFINGWLRLRLPSSFSATDGLCNKVKLVNISYIQRHSYHSGWSHTHHLNLHTHTGIGWGKGLCLFKT